MPVSLPNYSPFRCLTDYRVSLRSLYVHTKGFSFDRGSLCIPYYPIFAGNLFVGGEAGSFFLLSSRE